jgi:hypothetical protein
MLGMSHAALPCKNNNTAVPESFAVAVDVERATEDCAALTLMPCTARLTGYGPYSFGTSSGELRSNSMRPALTAHRHRPPSLSSHHTIRRRRWRTPRHAPVGVAPFDENMLRPTLVSLKSGQEGNGDGYGYCNESRQRRRLTPATPLPH